MRSRRTTAFITATLALLVAFGACGDDGGGNGSPSPASGADRAGPEALSGFTWSSSQAIDGIDFEFGLAFDATTVTVTNTCSFGGDKLTATASTPVRYRYRAEVLESKEAGDESCSVYARESTFDFEIVDGKLVATSGAERIEFTSAGTHSGLYGDWSASGNGITITWSMGSGKIRVTGSCEGSSARPMVEVAADFQNFFDISQATEATVGDESFNCMASIAAGTTEYYFDGAALVLSQNGEEARLQPR